MKLTIPFSEEPFAVRAGEDAIVVSFRTPARVLSWALLNGGLCQSDHIVNHYVRNDDLRFCADPRSWLTRAVETLALDGKTVAMATAVPMKNYAQVSFAGPNARVTCLATVGCGNALAAGDPASAAITEAAHTINLIVMVQPALSDAAMVEAIQIATEGRARALQEAGIRSSVSNLPASGTGTDCIAIASLGGGPGAEYCGKHTELGELIGRAAYAAVQQGLTRGSGGNDSGEGQTDDRDSAVDQTTFASSERAALYKVIFARRDVRRFLPSAIADDVIERILLAAHHAPSVGFMQPWNFILIRDPLTRRSIKEAFLLARSQETERFSGERRKLYRSLKLEGIEEAPLNICVTCDSTRHGPAVLGRTQMPQTDLYSTCCAIENLWLAARVEGLGVGWVSIVPEMRVKEILSIPAHVAVVGYLCIGYPTRFETKPELETAGWLNRLKLADVVRNENWDGSERS